MADFPRPSDASIPNAYGSIPSVQPEQTRATGKKQIIDGQSLINQNAPGKLNENRFSSLKPSRNDK